MKGSFINARRAKAHLKDPLFDATIMVLVNGATIQLKQAADVDRYIGGKDTKFIIC
jgi:hypothetical protein